MECLENRFSLTVAIPNYNNEKYIIKCIQSVCEQTYPVKEIIVVDDCSTDMSRVILKDLEHKLLNLRVIELKKNGGVSNARNVAIDACRTPYITFIDADDFYASNDKLSKEMQIIKEHYPKNVLAYSYLVYADEPGNIYTSEINKRNYLEGNVLFRYLIGRGRHAVARDYCILNSTLIKVGGYKVDQNFYEDLDLLIRLANECEYYCTFAIGTAYRQKPGGLSQKTSADHQAVKNSIRCSYLYLVPYYKRICLKVYWWLLNGYRKIKIFRK